MTSIRPDGDAGASDEVLLAACGSDAAAFQLLWDRYAEAVLGFFLNRVDDREACFDLTAETFADLYFRRQRFDADRGAVGQWLFGLAKIQLARYRRRQSIEFRAMRRLRMRRPSDDPTEVDGSDRVVEIVSAEARSDELVAALGRLSPRERQAVELRVVAGKPYAEIGAELGCSAGNARVRVHRGLKKLEAAVDAMPAKEMKS